MKPQWIGRRLEKVPSVWSDLVTDHVYEDVRMWRLTCGNTEICKRKPEGFVTYRACATSMTVISEMPLCISGETRRRFGRTQYFHLPWWRRQPFSLKRQSIVTIKTDVGMSQKAVSSVNMLDGAVIGRMFVTTLRRFQVFRRREVRYVYKDRVTLVLKEDWKRRRHDSRQITFEDRCTMFLRNVRNHSSRDRMILHTLPVSHDVVFIGRRNRCSMWPSWALGPEQRAKVIQSVPSGACS
jgi:hypothetical protein